MLDPEANEREEYQAKIRMHHDHFLATMVNFRSAGHFCCDITLILGTIILVFAGLNALVAKERISPYWSTWAPDRDRWLWNEE